MKQAAEKTLRGQVVRLPYASGSKSEHHAICLQDTRGAIYRLRLLDGEPQSDPRLEDLVGKSISATGRVVHGNTLIIKDWAALQQ